MECFNKTDSRNLNPTHRCLPWLKNRQGTKRMLCFIGWGRPHNHHQHPAYAPHGYTSHFAAQWLRTPPGPRFLAAHICIEQTPLTTNTLLRALKRRGFCQHHRPRTSRRGSSTTALPTRFGPLLALPFSHQPKSTYPLASERNT